MSKLYRLMTGFIGGAGMSYDIQLVHPRSGAHLRANKTHQLRGGTYALGGTKELWLNVTYNYAPHFQKVFGEDGIRAIHGMTGEESIPVLMEAMAKLSDDVDADYWAATEGNAKSALADLVRLAKLGPQGVWRVQ